MNPYEISRLAMNRGIESEVETFFETAPHPETEGLNGTAGSVADFLEGQQADESIDAWISSTLARQY